MMRIFIRNESTGEKVAKRKILNCANCVLRLLTCKEVKKNADKNFDGDSNLRYFSLFISKAASPFITKIQLNG